MKISDSAVHFLFFWAALINYFFYVKDYTKSYNHNP